MEKKVMIKQMFEDGFTLSEIRNVVNLDLEGVVIRLCEMHKAGEMDITQWIERNVNSETLFKAVQYLKPPKPTVEAGAKILQVDINLMRFADAYVFSPQKP